MKRADLHIHTTHSQKPSQWYLHILGVDESYTEPEKAYRMAKARGMDFITVTDHNQISGAVELKEKYPDEVIVGVESTTYFPEDECKVHLQIFGLNESQFDEVQKLRKNIYELREFIREQDLAHSVAHATYAVNGKMSLQRLEQLVLLFDVFEGLNGTRDMRSNMVWEEFLRNLTPDHIEKMRHAHGIEPYSDTPWIKGITGGSDDHAGLYIGMSYTEAEADSVDDFYRAIKEKKTSCGGRYNNFYTQAFQLFKVGFDHSMRRSKSSSSFFNKMADIVMNGTKITMTDKLKLQVLKHKKSFMENPVNKVLLEMADELSGEMPEVDERLDIVYRYIEKISWVQFSSMINMIGDSIRDGYFSGIVRGISSIIPAAAVAAPFIGTAKLIHSSRRLSDEILEKYPLEKFSGEKTILWFTDTLIDQNGVSITLSEISRVAWEQNRNIYIVTSIPEEYMDQYPPNVINMKPVYEIPLPYYEDLMIRFPSFLSDLRKLEELKPDMVYISTPNPVGLLGIFFSRLTNLKSIGVYHSDFASQAAEIMEDEKLPKAIDKYLNWFYERMKEIRVPTNEYIKLLQEKGFARDIMKIFPRAIDRQLFSPEKRDRDFIKEITGRDDAFVVLFSGRVSQDKNMDFLAEVVQEARATHDNIHCIIVGEGPYFNSYKDQMKEKDYMHCTGRLPREDIARFYASADVFMFPSVTDTFGMVVLEAQSCGLPSLVSDKGGPKELVRDGASGMVLEAGNRQKWVDALLKYHALSTRHPEEYRVIRENARVNTERFGWKAFFDDILEIQ